MAVEIPLSKKDAGGVDLAAARSTRDVRAVQQPPRGSFVFFGFGAWIADVCAVCPRGQFRNILQRSISMSDTKDKIKQGIDDAASKAKQATDKVVNKTKEAGRAAGEKVKEAGQYIRDKSK
jgi:hypothetical protein